MEKFKYESRNERFSQCLPSRVHDGSSRPGERDAVLQRVNAPIQTEQAGGEACCCAAQRHRLKVFATCVRLLQKCCHQTLQIRRVHSVMSVSPSAAVVSQSLLKVHMRLLVVLKVLSSFMSRRAVLRKFDCFYNYPQLRRKPVFSAKCQFLTL